MREALMLLLLVLGVVHFLRGAWYWSVMALVGMAVLGTAMDGAEWANFAYILEVIIRSYNSAQSG